LLMFYLPRLAIPRIFSRPVCAVEGAIRDYVVEAVEHSRERCSGRAPPSAQLRGGRPGRPFESVNGLTEEPLRQVLHNYFAWATTTTMSAYHHSADDVPPRERTTWARIST
jgi:hypothetical protein